MLVTEHAHKIMSNDVDRLEVEFQADVCFCGLGLGVSHQASNLDDVSGGMVGKPAEGAPQVVGVEISNANHGPILTNNIEDGCRGERRSNFASLMDRAGNATRTNLGTPVQQVPVEHRGNGDCANLGTFAAYSN